MATVNLSFIYNEIKKINKEIMIELGFSNLEKGKK